MGWREKLGIPEPGDTSDRSPLLSLPSSLAGISKNENSPLPSLLSPESPPTQNEKECSPSIPPGNTPEAPTPETNLKLVVSEPDDASDTSPLLSLLSLEFGTPEAFPAIPAGTLPVSYEQDNGISMAQWKADWLNHVFKTQGTTGERGWITAETVRDGERKRETAAVQK